MARKPLLYFAGGRWNCSVKLPGVLVVGHGTTPLGAWGDMHQAIYRDPTLTNAWVNVWLEASRP